MSAIGTFRIATLTAAVLGALPIMAIAADDDIEHIEVRHLRQPFRGDVPLNQQPQAIEVLSTERLTDAGVTDFISALDMSAAVSRQNNFGGVWDSFAVRGFVGDENVPSGYLVNGYNAGRGFGGTRDTSNIESIEVMKGPGSALYGRSEPGGTINIITKKPQFATQGYLQLSAGRWDNYRVEGDVTGALSDNVAARINGAYEDKGSFRSPIAAKKTVLTPSLLWLLNEQTRLSYELEYVDQEVPFDRGVVAINGDPSALPVTRFLGEPSDGPNQVDVLGHQLSVEHDFGDWSLLAGAAYRDTSLKGFSSDPELVHGRQSLFTDGETLSRQHSYRDFAATDFSGRLELSGSFQFASLQHHLLAGIDGYHYEFDKYWQRYRPAVGDSRYSINVFNPQYGQQAPAMALLKNETETQDSYGIYLQDQVDLTSQWKMQLGGRFDSFKQQIDNHISASRSEQTQHVFSPRAGLVYQWREQVSFYSSYAEGFRSNTGADFQGVAFEPEESKSYEVGTKFEYGAVTGSIALFKAEKSNVLTADPLNSGYSAALGKAESRGVELELMSYLSDDTQLWVSYAYTDAQTANDVINADWGVNMPSGSRLINIPKHSANVSVKHHLNLFGHEASIGGSVNYVGERLGETIDPDYVLPDYTLVNLFGSYAINSQLLLQLNVTNLFDEQYYPSSYSAIWTMPGEPRSYKVSVKYSF